jgi:hypothetical protein
MGDAVADAGKRKLNLKKITENESTNFPEDSAISAVNHLQLQWILGGSLHRLPLSLAPHPCPIDRAIGIKLN